MDPSTISCCQIRGTKRVYLFDPRDRTLVTEEELERFYSGAHRNMKFDDAWRDKAWVLRPVAGPGAAFSGDGAALCGKRPQHPISFSITFRTPDLDRASMVHNVNAYLRRRGCIPSRSVIRRGANGLKASGYRIGAERALSWGGPAHERRRAAADDAQDIGSDRARGDERSGTARVGACLAGAAGIRACGKPDVRAGLAARLVGIYGRGRELRVGLFHDGDRLVGVAPLCRRRFWHRPGIPMRRLEFLGGDDNEDDGVCSEYLRPIIQARLLRTAWCTTSRRPCTAGAFGRLG